MEEIGHFWAFSGLFAESSFEVPAGEVDDVAEQGLYDELYEGNLAFLECELVGEIGEVEGWF